MFQCSALLSLCFLLFTSNSISTGNNNPEIADTWLTAAKHPGLTWTLIVHSFPTFSGNTAPLLSLDYVPPCKTEPRPWLVNNFMYHSLQCIILKHISRLFSWQLLTDKKIPSLAAKHQLLFHDFRNHCNIVKIDKCQASNSLWATFLDPSNSNYAPPLASSLHKAWEHHGLHINTHHSKRGRRTKKEKNPKQSCTAFLSCKRLVLALKNQCF